MSEHSAWIEGYCLAYWEERGYGPEQARKMGVPEHLRAEMGLNPYEPMTYCTPFPEEGPEVGHTFRITVETRSSYGVRNEEGYRDESEFTGPVLGVEIRAWDLRGALERAQALHLWQWWPDEYAAREAEALSPSRSQPDEGEDQAQT